MKAFLFALLFITVPVFAADSVRPRAVQRAQQIGAAKLRADVKLLLATPAAQKHDIPRDVWPASVRQLQPQAVQLHMDGILFVFASSDGWQHGIFLLPDLPYDPGVGGSGVSYEPLGDGLFWCSERIRVAAQASKPK